MRLPMQVLVCEDLIVNFGNGTIYALRSRIHACSRKAYPLVLLQQSILIVAVDTFANGIYQEMVDRAVPSSSLGSPSSEELRREVLSPLFERWHFASE